MITNDDDLAMMRRPNRWPLWPVLPVKHRHKKDKDGIFPVHGVLLEEGFAGARPIVYETYCHQPKFDNVPKHTYLSLEALAEDWMVD